MEVQLEIFCDRISREISMFATVFLVSRHALLNLQKTHLLLYRVDKNCTFFES